MTKTWMAQHGWGFGASFWDPLRSQIPQGDTFIALDRGYFHEPIAGSNIPCDILITHSFGLHLVDPAYFAHLEKLIIISGFLKIHSEKLNTGAYLELIAKTMKTHPAAALKLFFRYCEADRKVSDTLNVSLLQEDLQRLNEDTLDYTKLLSIPGIEIVHGENDRIAHVDKAYELHKVLPNSTLSLISGAPHALKLGETCNSFL